MTAHLGKSKTDLRIVCIVLHMSIFVKIRWALLLPLLLLLSTSCRERGPEQSFRAFYLAVSKSDGQAAWALLSRETQQGIEKYIAASTQPGVKAPSAQKMLVEGGYLRAVRQLASVETINQARGRATLKVVDETGETQLVTLIKEDDTWRLLLPIPKT